MLVHEIMTKKIETISADKTVFEACNKFKELTLGSLVVVEDGFIIGIITERDVVEQIILEKRNPVNTRVVEIMTPNLKTIHSLATIEEASDIMKKNTIKKLPVIYNNNLVGIITDTDISHAINIIKNNF